MKEKKKKFIDLSHLLENSMPVYPGDNPISIVQDHKVVEGGYNNFLLNSGMHIGTHIDTPMHMLDIKKHVSEIKINRFTGNAKVIDCTGQSIILLSKKIEKKIKKNDNVLFHTGFDKFWGEEKYFSEHPDISEELVDFLLHKKINLIGFDSPSPDKAPYSLHKKLFRNDILIIENLTNLDLLLKYKKIRLFAFPLHIKADSSLIRAVAEVE